MPRNIITKASRVAPVATEQTVPADFNTVAPATAPAAETPVAPATTPAE